MGRRMAESEQQIEQSLATSAERIMAHPNVSGVICADEQGRSYCCRGTMDERSAAILSQITMLAAQMESPIEPVVSLQSETSRVLMRRYSDIVVGVHKKL